MNSSVFNINHKLAADIEFDDLHANEMLNSIMASLAAGRGQVRQSLHFGATPFHGVCDMTGEEGGCVTVNIVTVAEA